MSTREDIVRMLLTLLEQRTGRSLCPSDVARALHPYNEAAWRALMPAVRDAAIHLARAGEVVITRKGAVLPPDDLGPGPIRISPAPRK